MPAAWVAQVAQTDPAVNDIADSGAIWNQCPHFGQPLTEFLAWHRAYLFHSEEILADAAALTFLAAADVPLADTEGPGMLSVDAPSAVRLSVPEDQRLSATAVGPGAGPDQRVILDLLDIEFDHAPTVRYDVFVNPEGEPEGPDSPGYVGSLDIFMLSAMAGTDGDGAQASFDITDRVSGTPELSELDVRIVPVDQTVGDAALRSSGEMRVGRLRLRLSSGGAGSQ